MCSWVWSKGLVGESAELKEKDDRMEDVVVGGGVDPYPEEVSDS